MNFEEKQLSSTYKYKGRIISLRYDEVELPNGDNSSREVVEHPGGVCVAAITDDDKILMVRQFRYPYGEVIYEIPAGKRDKSGEDPLECGKRELKEETGASAEKYTFLGQLYPSPGYCNEIIYMYAATGLSYGEQQPDEDEFLSCESLPLDEVTEMIMSGKIKDAKTQAAVLKVKYMREKGII